MSPAHVVPVAVETPQHTAVGGLLDYASERPLAPGTLVSVPLGRREVPGIVWHGDAQGVVDAGKLRSVGAQVLSLPPLSAPWRRLVEFAATYYQRGIGELALAVLPPELRRLDDIQLARRVAKLQRLEPPAGGDARPAPAPERRAGRRADGAGRRPPAGLAARRHR